MPRTKRPRPMIQLTHGEAERIDDRLFMVFSKDDDGTMHSVLINLDDYETLDVANG